MWNDHGINNIEYTTVLCRSAYIYTTTNYTSARVWPVYHYKLHQCQSLTSLPLLTTPVPEFDQFTTTNYTSARVWPVYPVVLLFETAAADTMLVSR